MSQPPIHEPNATAQQENQTLEQSSLEQNPTCVQPKSLKLRIWQIFKLCTRIIVYVPLSLLVLTALLLGTEIGSRVSVGLADKFVPDLALTYTSGSLNKDLTLAHASWSMDGIKVELKDLHLAWQPTCLLQKRLCVNALTASQIDVNIDTEALSAGGAEVDVPPENAEPSELVLPFGIKLDSAELNNINIAVDKMRFSANHIQTAATWFAEGLTVEQLSSEGLAVLIPTDDSPAPDTQATALQGANTQITSKQVTDTKAAETTAAAETTSAATTPPQPETEKSATAVITASAKTTADKPITDKDSAKAPANPQANKQTDENTDKQASTEEWALAHLPQVFMPFPVDIKHLSLDNSRLQIGPREDLFSHIELQGKFAKYQLTLEKLLLAHSYGEVSVVGQLALEQDYPLALEVQANVTQVAELPELTHQQLSLTLSQSVGQLGIHALAKGDVDFSLNGQLTLKDPTLPYKVKLEKARAQWPLQHAEYLVSDLNLDSQGSLTQQAATLNGNVTTPFHKVLAISSELHHQDAKLDIKQFNAKGELGSVDVTGELDYAKAITWKAKVLLDNLKLQEITLLETAQTPETTPKKDSKAPSTNTDKPAPATANAPAPATTNATTSASASATSSLPNSLISGQLQTTGRLLDKQWQVALTDTQLSGTMQGYPFDITADVSINDKLYISAKGVNAKVLGSTLTLAGETNKTWNLEGKLQVPDFGLWLPQASGQLQADINVTGDEKHPQVELTAQLVDLVHQNIKLRESTLKAYYKPLDAHEFALSLKSKALQLGSQSLDTVTLGSKGDIQNQKLTLSASGDLGLELGVTSQYDMKKSQLQAQVNKINLATPVGRWEIDKDILVAWDQNKSKGNISPFCLVNPNSKVCLDNQVTIGKTGEAQLSYAGNLGKLLVPVLPNNMQWEGGSSLLANFAWAAGRKPTANVDFNFTPGSIKLKRAKNREVTINYQQLDFKANLDAKRLLSSISFESEDVASWQSEVTVNVTPDRTLSGYANIKQINLQPLGEFFPQLNTLEGLLTSRLNFAGTLDAPEVSGNVSLTQGALALTANPTLINKIDMSMDLGGQQASLKGRWMMGNGLGRVTGDMRWPQGQFSGELAIKGDKLAVIQPPLALLDVSPDLTIAFSSQQLEVKGVVDVPSGNIKIVQLAEGGVALSEDVVFDDSIAAAQPKASPYAIVADLNINVGNDLKVDGMGLKGKLQGTLKLQQQAFRPPLLFGDIKVKQGSYKFMGQTLKIRTGEVQFVGPTSVPNLNIEAIREIKSEDLVAGVRVTGTPARPVVTLFSNPAKEQAEILSYIIKGSGFNSSNNEQNNSLMMGAALGLGSQVGGGGAINNIGSTATGIIEEFGFSNVQLDTNDEGRVAISGFIGDNLMVKYGVGVFNPGYEMTVRYYLLSQLYLETVSGTLGQSLDIYYNFNIK
ncbi:translocation/assembly module TamB domain-containing protein [Shewanella sp. FJAT-51649]|uniref:translocation/assembly module TamB domain-containing protein n=1 Tax=Shewanella sp. FJAT-51649 TaxID=2864210 RepID=UPI001C660244|nr:translocation/assembly module TamB domain-containing protein [Shewanella sp. FJAT-51649]QYJ73306.1 translocation/assembly module TamB domain-containing protein [Shewanella sp. FJAT-51649]